MKSQKRRFGVARVFRGLATCTVLNIDFSHDLTFIVSLLRVRVQGHRSSLMRCSILLSLTLTTGSRSALKSGVGFVFCREMIYFRFGA